MQFREKTDWNRLTGETKHIFRNMSAQEFNTRYGKTFSEWKSELSKDDYRKKFKFSECYVDDDPYDSDIHGETTPLIENSPERLYEAIILSADEI